MTLIVVTHAIEEAAVLGKTILLLGTPPNRDARVFENPKAGHPNYRGSGNYQKLCNLLREELQHEAA